jgi:L-lactate dehydrogenase complex protein LldF
MGAVLTPVFDGLEKTRDLPHACTMNGRCREVCPVDIPLPTLLRGWRERSWREGLEPATTRAGLGLFGIVASRPWLFHFATSAAVRVMRLFKRGGRLQGMPLIGAWTRYRDFPAPSRQTFMEMVRNSENQPKERK